MEKEKEMFKMKKFIPIVGLLIVGLMILSGCSTELPKEDSEDVKVEVSTGNVEYTHSFRYGCTLEGDTVFVTVDNTNTEFQMLAVNGEDIYFISPLSVETIEIPIPEDFEYAIRAENNELIGTNPLAKLNLTQVEYTPKYDKEGNVIKDLEILNNLPIDTWSTGITDVLSLYCDYSQSGNNISPSNIGLVSKNEAVSKKVGEIVCSVRGKLDRTDGLKVK